MHVDFIRVPNAHLSHLMSETHSAISPESQALYVFENLLSRARVSNRRFNVSLGEILPHVEKGFVGEFRSSVRRTIAEVQSSRMVAPPKPLVRSGRLGRVFDGEVDGVDSVAA